MTLVSGVNAQLRSIVERIERLEEEKKTIASDIKEVYAEAKGNGFDTKALRSVISIRKKDPDEFQQEQAVLDLYLSALGMTPLEEAVAAAEAEDEAEDDIADAFPPREADEPEQAAKPKPKKPAKPQLTVIEKVEPWVPDNPPKPMFTPQPVDAAPAASVLAAIDAAAAPAPAPQPPPIVMTQPAAGTVRVADPAPPGSLDPTDPGEPTEVTIDDSRPAVNRTSERDPFDDEA